MLLLLVLVLRPKRKERGKVKQVEGVTDKNQHVDHKVGMG